MLNALRKSRGHKLRQNFNTVVWKYSDLYICEINWTRFWNRPRLESMIIETETSRLIKNLTETKQFQLAVLENQPVSLASWRYDGFSVTTLPPAVPSLYAVSYTHLDVYKRQTLFLPSLFFMPCLCFLGVFHFIFFIVGWFPLCSQFLLLPPSYFLYFDFSTGFLTGQSLGYG